MLGFRVMINLKIAFIAFRKIFTREIIPKEKISPNNMKYSSPVSL